jgi:hypothetical protein
VTGGYVVHDPALATLSNRYVYADLCAGQLRSFVPTAGGASDDKPLGLSVATPTSFGVDSRRRVYVASLQGAVYQLVPG